jgi:light-regulated signal transduction histidine kinase (bacteriophytochrome)
MPVNYDATFCGKLPIHQTNSIQPHGVLLILDTSLKKVIQVSENVNELLQKPAIKVAGSLVSDYLSTVSIDALQLAVKDGWEGKLPLTLYFIVNNIEEPVFCQVHAIEEGLIVEAELKSYYKKTPKTFIEIYQHIRQVMQHINRCHSIDEVCTIAARQIKRSTGFDKVMIYRFDENWNGTVLAEEAETGMENYLGLTFPASDVPKPVRDMYLKNPYRLIPNREYTSAKLFPLLNPVSNGFASLLNTDLRSVATVHLEYLKNMQVMASMSIRIVYQDKLWGLIACHHRQPKYLSFEECSAVEMISGILSQKISSLQNAEGVEIRQQLMGLYAAIVEKMADKTSMLEAFHEHANLFRDFLGVDGIALIWEGSIETNGSTPNHSDIEVLLYWLRQKEFRQTFHHNQLSLVFEESKSFSDLASGLIVLPIQPEKGNYLVGFRSELVHTVSWGGNPDDAVQFEPNSTIYHPRHSFQVWKQTVHYTAKNWHDEEVTAVEQFRNFLVQHTLNRLN